MYQIKGGPSGGELHIYQDGVELRGVTSLRIEAVPNELISLHLTLQRVDVDVEADEVCTQLSYSNSQLIERFKEVFSVRKD